jgi:hypothetical protein
MTTKGLLGSMVTQHLPLEAQIRRRILHPLCPALMLASICPRSLDAQISAQQLVAKAQQNEAAHRNDPGHVSYLSRETSTRTGGHLWKDKVAEVPQGTICRLIEIDGRPLSPRETHVEEERIADVVAHPEKLHKASPLRIAIRNQARNSQTLMSGTTCTSHSGQTTLIQIPPLALAGG